MGCVAAHTKKELEDQLAKKDAELKKKDEQIADLSLARLKFGTRNEGPRVNFYFVLADKLRKTDVTVLPALQTLLEEESTRDWIIKKEMSFDDACNGAYAVDFLAVSHRWLTDGMADPRRAHPDSKGVQLTHIKQHLMAYPMVKYVWLDWLCMWQANKDGNREITADEKSEFKHMLGEVNLLYIGCKVLILLDVSYLSRFWTVYETWLSSLVVTAQGLQLASGTATRRHIVPILGASEGYKSALVSQIEHKMQTVEEAAAYLKNDDVTVTNAGDKEQQLAKVSRLNERACGAKLRNGAAAEVEKALRADPIITAALKQAVNVAETLGVADDKLFAGRHMLKVVGDGRTIPQVLALRAENDLLTHDLIEFRGTVLHTMLHAKGNATVAKACGYSLNELKAAGYVQGLKAAGFSCDEMKGAGYLTSEVAQAGFGADEAKAAGFLQTIEEAKAAGYVEGLAAGGFSGLKAAGFSVDEAFRGGYSSQDIKNMGYTQQEILEKLKASGYTWKQLKDAGCTYAEADSMRPRYPWNSGDWDRL